MKRNAPILSTTTQLLKLPEVLDRVKVCRSYLFKLIASGQFPKPKKVGRLSFWSSTDVEAYVDHLLTGEPVGPQGAAE